MAEAGEVESRKRPRVCDSVVAWFGSIFWKKDNVNLGVLDDFVALVLKYWEN